MQYYSTTQIRKAVKQLLDEGKWPEYQTYDDCGLSLDDYVQFIEEVLHEVDQPTPTPPK